MPYLFATEDQDYSDYASGRVLYNLPSAPAFPVRMASEIFQRARARLGLQRRLAIYDPACGGAYHLCALGFLHGAAIEAIVASDSSYDALSLARRNLALLSQDGLRRREAEIRAMLAEFGKESHAAALHSAAVLRQRLEQFTGSQEIRTRIFQANALDEDALRQGLSGEPVDLVICDVPYGSLSEWDLPPGEDSTQEDPLWRMLNALRAALPEPALVAIAADKRQKIAHPGYSRIERFQIGKRQAALLKPV
jgi:23S rRNA (guanine2535-N1)-methyltransferase